MTDRTYLLYVYTGDLLKYLVPAMDPETGLQVVADAELLGQLNPHAPDQVIGGAIAVPAKDLGPVAWRIEPAPYAPGVRLGVTMPWSWSMAGDVATQTDKQETEE